MCICMCIRLIRHLWLVTLWSEYFYFIAFHRQRKRYVNLPVYTHIHIYIYVQGIRGRGGWRGDRVT